MMTFKDQMELRRGLMELGNTSMEISLESSRNALILSEWEAEQSKAKEVRWSLVFTFTSLSLSSWTIPVLILVLLIMLYSDF